MSGSTAKPLRTVVRLQLRNQVLTAFEQEHELLGTHRPAETVTLAFATVLALESRPCAILCPAWEILSCAWITALGCSGPNRLTGYLAMRTSQL
jgi:hypothetical protein